jgi:Protein of unknown function (DUF3618)
MGEDPRDVEQRIENTRERMGETVEALSAKADVPGRVKGYMEDKKDAVTSKVSGVKEKVTGAAGSAGDSGSQVAGQTAQAARNSAGIVKENPLGLAIGSVAVGFLLGMTLPTSRIEDERLGPLSDQVKDQVREVGGEAIEHGKELAQDAAQAAADTAKETGREHATDLQTSVGESARETVEQARS